MSNYLCPRPAVSLQILTRSGMETHKLKEEYVSWIRSVWEYAYHLWTPGLTQQHMHNIEWVQKESFLYH